MNRSAYLDDMNVKDGEVLQCKCSTPDDTLKDGDYYFVRTINGIPHVYNNGWMIPSARFVRTI